jgi:hypothetical protein
MPKVPLLPLVSQQSASATSSYNQSTDTHKHTRRRSSKTKTKAKTKTKIKTKKKTTRQPSAMSYRRPSRVPHHAWQEESSSAKGVRSESADSLIIVTDAERNMHEPARRVHTSSGKEVPDLPIARVIAWAEAHDSNISEQGKTTPGPGITRATEHHHHPWTSRVNTELKRAFTSLSSSPDGFSRCASALEQQSARRSHEANPLRAVTRLSLYHEFANPRRSRAKSAAATNNISNASGDRRSRSAHGIPMSSIGKRGLAEDKCHVHEAVMPFDELASKVQNYLGMSSNFVV